MTRIAIALLAIITFITTGCKEKVPILAPEVCACTNTTLIYKDDSVTVSLPTAFTPNSDGRNDVFKPIVTLGDVLKYYEFSVVDAKRETLFSTTERYQAWNGIMQNGNSFSNGKYYYQLKFTTQTGQLIDVCGCVHLISYHYDDCIPIDMQNNVFEDQIDINLGTVTYMSSEEFCTD